MKDDVKRVCKNTRTEKNVDSIVTNNAPNTRKCSWSTPFIEDALVGDLASENASDFPEVIAKLIDISNHSPFSWSCQTVLAWRLGKNVLLKNASTFLAFFGLINCQFVSCVGSSSSFT